MNTCSQSAAPTNPDSKNRPRKSPIPGPRFALGFVLFRPKACRQVFHVDVFFALLRHLSGSFGELSLADLADKTRPVDFLTEHSAHYAECECLHLSAFRDRRGTKFFLLTLEDLTTVVSLPEEF